MAKLPYEAVSGRVSREAEDPHAEGIFWRYDGKWGLHLRGDELREVHKDAWSWGGAENFIPTPERIELWYNLMREVVYDDA